MKLKIQIFIFNLVICFLATCGGSDDGVIANPKVCTSSGAEICDQKDNDCDGEIDEGLTQDVDKDGYTTGVSCSGTKNDCNDNDKNINPGMTEVVGNGKNDDCNASTNDDGTCTPQTEICDGMDNDCDEIIDDELPLNTFYLDKDNDGYGNLDSETQTCSTTPPSGYVSKSTDCNDNDILINPVASEICGDGVDQDCNGADLSCNCEDSDGDGFANKDCGGNDCNDADIAINPSITEIIGNGKDDDCNHLTLDVACVSQQEICGDGIDQDCNGSDLTCSIPAISVSPISLNFSATVGGSNPINQTLNISNSGSGTLNWTVSKTNSWLTLSPTSGTNNVVVVVSVNIAGLSVSTHSDTVVISATGASNTPQNIPVNLTINPSSSDATPPTVISTNPLDGATNVSIDSNIIITFSEDMDSNSITLNTFILNITGAEDWDASLGTFSYDSASKTVTFNPQLNLQYSNNYTATITTGVKDLAGNPIGSDYPWDFTTVSAPDTTPPNTTLTAKPANPSNSTAPEFSFTSSETGSTFQCQFDSGGYSSCTSPKSYTRIGVDSHTFDVRAIDSAGNTDTTPASYTWTIDTTRPTILYDYLTPKAGSADVPIESFINIIFSELMNTSTISSTTYTLKQDSTVINGTFYFLTSNINNVSVTVASFIPTNSLEYLTPYTVTIDNSVKDLAGNTIGSNYSWGFTTEMVDQKIPPGTLPY